MDESDARAPSHSPLATRLFLTGYRGTGKTTVAKHLAVALGWSWVDTDDLVETSAGKSIAEIFAADGETAFRDLEQQAIAGVCDEQKTIIALGGGAILREANRKRIGGAGPVVWLTAPAETLAERLDADSATGTRRPNLTAAGGLAEIEQVLAERTPIYRACADLQVDTAAHTPEQIAREIAAWMSRS